LVGWLSGLGGPAILPGFGASWLVTVEGGQQRLVYHANASGSVLRLNEQLAK